MVAGALVAASLPASGGADPAATLQQRADELRRQKALLGSQSSEALLGLYALESRLAKARAQLARLQARADALRRERTRTQGRLAVARRALAVAERQLAEQLRALYEQGDTDPLAILLGATSLDEALAGLEGLNRAASHTRYVIDQTRSARRSLVALDRSLAARVAEVERLEAAAAGTAAALSRARDERAAYVARLASERRLNAAQISSLEAQARAALTQAQLLSVQQPDGDGGTSFPSAPATVVSTTPVASGSTMTVTATGYALRGRTATGIPTSWGVVAVDPAVIPLGTRMTIPGYGEGVAADTGPAVRGATIDLWFPTTAQALAWGRRTVTITLH